MSLRPDRPRHAHGPLSAEELASYLQRGFDDASCRFLARVWNSDEDLEILASKADQKDTLSLNFDELTGVARALLGSLARRGGRHRGETLRRDLLLTGFGESEEVLRSFVLNGYLVPLPNPGEHDCNIDALLEHGTLLQRDIAIPRGLFDTLEDLDQDDSLQAPAWMEVTIEHDQGDLQTLELNLLHVCALIRRDPLRLNKDGTPNRRSLGRVARGIRMPGTLGEVAADLDLHDALQFDYLTFLVAIARELQLLSERDSTYRTDDQELARYFKSDGPERDRRIIDALQRLRFWNEIDSARIAQSPHRSVEDVHFSQFESTGQPLIGARGFVVSVLRRAHFSDWVALEALIDLCGQLDHQYLERTLSQLSSAPNPREFIHAVLTRTLVWGGILQPGRSENNTPLLRLSPRGARALGLPREVPKPAAGGCLIVQPNFEVMVFLDNASINVLHELYRLGERKKLSDRVATFHLAAESVQRGYAIGGSAEGLITLLADHGHTPVPDAVAFQLRDWERVHRRLTIHLGGAALRHPDPERFDLICGQIEHDLRDSDVTLVRLGPRDAFVTDATHPAVERAAAGKSALTLDALGAPPRCLHFVAPLVLLVDPYEWDISTSVQLQKFADPIDEDSSPRSLFFELQIDKIKSHFGTASLSEVIAFLDPRCPDGLPPAQRLRLTSELTTPPAYHLESDVVVLSFEDLETTEIFAQLPDADFIVRRRLGPTTYAIKTDRQDLLHEVIEELRLRHSDAPFPHE